MMGEDDLANLHTPARHGQELMAQLTRRHFDRKPMSLGKRPHIPPAHDNFEPQQFCRVAHQTLVCVAASPAQTMIKMRNGQFPAAAGGKFVEYLQKDD